jgi:hypothetical protein
VLLRPETDGDALLWTARGQTRTFQAVARFTPHGYVLRMLADDRLLWSRTFETWEELLAEVQIVRAIHADPVGRTTTSGNGTVCRSPDRKRGGGSRSLKNKVCNWT